MRCPMCDSENIVLYWDNVTEARRIAYCLSCGYSWVVSDLAIQERRDSTGAAYREPSC